MALSFPDPSPPPSASSKPRKGEKDGGDGNRRGGSIDATDDGGGDIDDDTDDDDVDDGNGNVVDDGEASKDRMFVDRRFSREGPSGDHASVEERVRKREEERMMRAVRSVCGRGTGLDDEGVERKVGIVTRALRAHGIRMFCGSEGERKGETGAGQELSRKEMKAETRRILAAVGGAEIAAMVGATLRLHERGMGVIVGYDCIFLRSISLSLFLDLSIHFPISLSLSLSLSLVSFPHLTTLYHALNSWTLFYLSLSTAVTLQRPQHLLPRR